MKLSVAICDDEQEMRELIHNYVCRLANELEISVEVHAFSDGEELLKEDTLRYQIVFLDVEMQRMNGFDTAEEIRKTNQKTEIVFVTVLSQYCSRGYHYKASRYLVKPVSYENFSYEMKKLFQDIEKKERISEELMNFMEHGLPAYDKLYYMESVGHAILFHTNEQTYERKMSMKKAAGLYEELGFCRIHQSFLVNMDKVEYVYEDKVFLENKTELYFSRGWKKEFQKRYAKFLSEKLV